MSRLKNKDTTGSGLLRAVAIFQVDREQDGTKVAPASMEERYFLFSLNKSSEQIHGYVVVAPRTARWQAHVFPSNAMMQIMRYTYA
jgi:hypothetical protein